MVSSLAGCSIQPVAPVPGQIISESESAFSPADALESSEAKFYPVAVRAAKEVAAVPGYLGKSSGDFGYLMLEELDPNVSTTFEQGRPVGKEQQRTRIAQLFHEELSSELLAAVFKIHLVKQNLECRPLCEKPNHNRVDLFCRATALARRNRLTC